MYPANRKIKDTIESNTSASYLDLIVPVNRKILSTVRISLYDKRDDFTIYPIRQGLLLLWIFILGRGNFPISVCKWTFEIHS